MKENKYHWFLVVLVFSVIACKKEGNTTDKTKKETTTQGVNDNVIAEEEQVTENNFKDTFKEFSLLGEKYQGIKKTVLIDDIYFTAAVMPKDYFIKKHITTITDSLGVYRKKLEKEEVIQFDFQLKNSKDILKEKAKNYEEYIKYLSHYIKNDFQIITTKDTIKPKGVHFERAFGLTPYKRLLLYFEFPTKETGEIKLMYHDNLFEKGIIKFKLKNSLRSSK